MQLINDMGKSHDVIQIFSEIQSAMSRMAKISKVISNALSIWKNFICEKLQSGGIKINYKPTEE